MANSVKKFLDASGVSILWSRFMDALDSESSRAKAAEKANKEAAEKAQSDVDDLKELVGTIPEDYTETTIISYIDKKAEETLESAQGGSSETAASVKTQLDNYKRDNDAAVGANTSAIQAIQADYLTSADKTELNTAIGANTTEIARVNAVLTAAIENEDTSALDSIKELATWIENHDDAAAGYAQDITALQNKVNTGEQTVTAYVASQLENYATDGELEALDGRVETLENAGYQNAEQVGALITTGISHLETKTDASTKLNTAKGYTDTEFAKIQSLSEAEIDAAIAAAE